VLLCVVVKGLAPERRGFPYEMDKFVAICEAVKILDKKLPRSALDGVSSSPECWDYCRGKNAKVVAVDYRPSDELCCCETECPCLADADGPFELTTAGSILELDECPGDESADDIPMNAADE
jgi:hypothetical protein